MGIMSSANKIECVKPRCANKLSGVFNQNVEMKSISGMLCANAPHSIAFLPKPFSKKASPMHAPKTIWVKESIIKLFTN